MYQVVLAAFLITACGVLNRVRGGGFGGQYLPGRALFWVAPVIGALTLLVSTWEVAAIMAVTYLFWGVFSWGHTLGALGGFRPPRPMTDLEAVLDLGYMGALIRMLFVLPGTIAIGYMVNNMLYALLAVPFAIAAVQAYKMFLHNPDEDDWQNAEIATGAAWALFLMVPLLGLSTPYFRIAF